MTDGGFYQQQRMNPQAVATVILLHGAAIAALVTVKMDMPISNPFTRTQTYNVPVPPPPPPPPPSTTQHPKQHQDSHLTTTHEIVQIPTTSSFPLPPPPPPTGDSALKPTPHQLVLPPPPTPPRTFEPARAHANLGSYVSTIDYPESAIRNNEEGTTRFRLSVGTDGRVTGCTVVGSSGSSALDNATCRLMKNRARFTPARDANGNAATDSVASAIRWVLPAG